MNALEDKMERWSKINLMEIPMNRWPLQESKKYAEMKRPGVRSDDDERRMVTIQNNYKKEHLKLKKYTLHKSIQSELFYNFVNLTILMTSIFSLSKDLHSMSQSPQITALY